MPPLILVVAGLLGGAAVVRFLAREGQRINRELDEARQADLRRRDDAPTLRRDPDTGAFRPN
jgi:hypothetical protein